MKLIINKEGAFHIDPEDDIVMACLMTRDGQLLKA
jgi:NAD(P) transhydrogenase subunit alpha